MTSVQEPILLGSSDDDSDSDVLSDGLADERPPSDEDYESSITLSSGDDDSDEEMEDGDDVNADMEEDASDDEATPEDKQMDKGVNGNAVNEGNRGKNMERFEIAPLSAVKNLAGRLLVCKKACFILI